MPLYNQEQIKEIIPHRDPFLLIDTVEELEPGIRVVATSTSGRMRTGSGAISPATGDPWRAGH